MKPRHRQVNTTTYNIDGFEVEVTRKRVKNINLRIRRDGTVAVSAPPRVPLSAIESFVSSRSSWIIAAKKRLKTAQTVSEMGCDENDTIMLWGRLRTCHILGQQEVAIGDMCRFELESDLLLVHASGSYAGNGPLACERRLVACKEWMRSILIRRAQELLPTCEERVGVHARLLRFRKMTSRWGSCNVQTGAITINTELVHYPESCLAYVLTHELCHLLEPSHNARFHALMDQLFPTWRKERSLLAHRPG